MIEWTVIFTICTVIAAIFGFTGIAAGLASTAKLLFYVFLSLSIISFAAAIFPKKKTSGLIIDIKYGE
ncbi:MAG: DUF1328 domain-containing protein [Desulfobulbaceae bacterium]|nr:DUF1328 domain-containing protein [Desulfobulbaceae bacterium]